jgi:gluconate 2-dehydrogenase gamma chain
LNRRQFIAFSASISWALFWPKKIAFALQGAVKRRVFNNKEWAMLGAVFEQIVPKSEVSPSAVDMGTLDFIEKGFSDEFHRFRWYPKTFSKSKIGYKFFVPYYRELIKRINQYSQKACQKDFTELEAAERTPIIDKFASQTGADAGYRVTGLASVSKITDAALFDMARRHCMQSLFSEVVYGGNRDYAGWKAISHICHMNYADKPENCPEH